MVFSFCRRGIKIGQVYSDGFYDTKCEMRSLQRCYSILLAGIVLGVSRVTAASQQNDQLRNDCGYSFTADQSSGAIYSPNYPFDYISGLLCQYTFHLADNHGTKRVCFTFLRFELQTVDELGVCSQDYVEFSGTRYCGAGVREIVREPTRTQNGTSGDLLSVWENQFCWTAGDADAFLLVTFVSQSARAHKGFYGYYQVWGQHWSTGDVNCEANHVTSLGASRLYVPGCLTTCPDGSTCNTLTEPDCTCQQHTVPCTEDEFTCFNRKCIPSRDVCNQNNDCGDDSDEGYDHARCPVRNLLGDAVPVCDFELDNCGLLGMYLWSIDTPTSFPPGPPTDHTKGPDGHYLRTDFIKKPEVQSIQFFTQTIGGTDKDVCMSFWYWLSSDDSGQLTVLYSGRVVWSSGHGTGRWHSAMISLTSTSRLTFEAVKGSDDAGLIALDDLYIHTGPCQQVLEPVCTFEYNACGWTQAKHPITTSKVDGAGWQLLGNSTIGEGQFVYIQAEDFIDIIHDVSIESPDISPNMADFYCLRFDLYMNNTRTKLTLARVYVTTQNTDYVKNVTNLQGDKWHKIEVSLEVDQLFKMVFIIKYLEKNDVIAIDNISITAGHCRDDADELSTVPTTVDVPTTHSSTPPGCTDQVNAGSCNTNDVENGTPPKKTLSALAILVVVAVAIILIHVVVTLSTVYMCSRRRARAQTTRRASDFSNRTDDSENTPPDTSSPSEDSIGSNRSHVLPPDMTLLENDSMYAGPGLYVPMYIGLPKYDQIHGGLSGLSPRSEDAVVLERTSNEAGSIDRGHCYRIRFIPGNESPPPPYSSGSHVQSSHTGTRRHGSSDEFRSRTSIDRRSHVPSETRSRDGTSSGMNSPIFTISGALPTYEEVVADSNTPGRLEPHPAHESSI